MDGQLEGEEKGKEVLEAGELKVKFLFVANLEEKTNWIISKLKKIYFFSDESSWSFSGVNILLVSKTFCSPRAWTFVPSCLIAELVIEEVVDVPVVVPTIVLIFCNNELKYGSFLKACRLVEEIVDGVEDKELDVDEGVLESATDIIF